MLELPSKCEFLVELAASNLAIFGDCDPWLMQTISAWTILA